MEERQGNLNVTLKVGEDIYFMDKDTGKEIKVVITKRMGNWIHFLLKAPENIKIERGRNRIAKVEL